jgi:hypothetical protein
MLIGAGWLHRDDSTRLSAPVLSARLFGHGAKINGDADL